MGCGSSAAGPEDPEKFPSHVLLQFTFLHIKPVNFHRNGELSKEHVFQILLECYR
jgi:hypothetical protein